MLFGVEHCRTLFCSVVHSLTVLFCKCCVVLYSVEQSSGTKFVFHLSCVNYLLNLLCPHQGLLGTHSIALGSHPVEKSQLVGKSEPETVAQKPVRESLM